MTSSIQRKRSNLAEIKGIDVTLQQALDFKYVTKPMTKEDVAPLFDMLAAKR